MVYLNKILSLLFDNEGLHSKRNTIKLIKNIENYNPDLINIHNIHGYYVNYRIFFSYLKSKKFKIVWTLHDAWAYTGHCAYYIAEKCDKWKNQCYSCPQKRKYPKSIFLDNSKRNFSVKKESFSNILDMVIVTPSEWLKSDVKKSFLSDYNIEVINNGVDSNVFNDNPRNYEATLKKYNLTHKGYYLSVSSVWDERKGLNDIIDFANHHKDVMFCVVGLSRKQYKLYRNQHNIVPILRTENQNELSHLYYSAIFLLNPTYEDNYPTVNLEAQMCGTPVLSYDSGGAKETLFGDSRLVTYDNLRNELPANDRNLDFGSYKLDMDSKYRFNDYIKLFEDIYDKS